jgi:phosphoglycolate phosphatase-like HAD superfamily hydrolase
MNADKLIVFDMDGVIMDVSGSYRDVVRRTTRLFFEGARGGDKLPEPLFDLSDLAALKQSGGLNNDWDLTFVVIRLLFRLVKSPATHESRDAWTRYRKTIARCDVDPIAAFMKTQTNPLISLLKKYGQPENDFVQSLYRGDVGSGNIIKQIFQELYLGRDLFQSTYHLTPEMYAGEGYILREDVLIDRSILEDLSRGNVLAIATGRPKAEAEYPLACFDLKRYFTLVFTLDDCLEEEKRIFEESGKKVSLSKPNPFMLDAIVRNCGQTFTDLYYIGDMPDDMLAAARSCFGFKSIGILSSTPNKKELKKELERAGANYLIEDFGELKKIVL